MPADKKETALALTDDAGTRQIIKQKRNRPDLEKFGQENVEPGDNARYLRYSRASEDLPPVDIADEKAVWERIKMYFDYCEQNDRKPHIQGACNWLGIDRTTWYKWKTGQVRSGTHFNMIKKADGELEEMWVDMMLNGKVNPASGIFIGKNHFGYRDVIDIAPAQPAPLGDTLTPEEIQSKYQDMIEE